MKETKTTCEEFETAFYASIEEMKEEFKVVTNSLKLEKELNVVQGTKIEKLESTIKGIRADLEMSTHMYGRETTRKIARDAFNQSTAEANWKSLEKHPVVKNLYQAIKDSRKDLGSSIQTNALRLDRAKPANEVFEELRNTDVITTIMARLADADSSIQGLINDVDNDRSFGNKQDLKLRDKLADLETCQNGFEFLLSETNDMFMNGFLFSIGAFGALGYKNVGEGLREIIKKPKEQKK